MAGDARSAGMRVLDLTAGFAAEGGDWTKWWAVAYDSHPSATAHAVVARVIDQYLRNERLLADGE